MTNNYVDSDMKYRKKPVVIEASQWFKNGDHPLDHESIGIETPNRVDLAKYSEYLETEGGVVRYFRHPGVSGETVCKHCSKTMHKHGWIDTLEGGHIVCPGDWIITGVQGERYPCKPHIFEKTYESAAQQAIPDIQGLVEALEEISDPIRFMKERLEEGERLNGMAAVELANDALYLRDIATAALASCRKGAEA